ncbi:MAG: hypothetical protein GY777_19355 [Candidatus Brocadiaceae bacterium]|nr:hypothetical protein [Candidatus Brocadiaceae bacterium]
MYRKLTFILLLVFFSGCIQQDLRVVLRPDGSGEYHIKKVTSQIESALIANIPSVVREKALSDQACAEKEYPSGLKRVSYSISPNPDDPAKYVESSVYTFSELGKVLPDLENVIKMGPRYAYRDNRFVVFLNREKSEFDGMQAGETIKDAWLNLTIELPSEPSSSNGVVQGKIVSWKFNADDMKKYQEMAIGENLIEASIPSSAINVDLTPRLVIAKEKKKLAKDGEFEPLVLYNARFPILGDMANEVAKASLNINFPDDKFSLPITYKDLKIKSLVVEGKETEADLKSKVEGVFDGKNQWGQETKGFPVQLEFPVTNPWVKEIERFEITMQVNMATEKSKTFYHVKPSESPRVILPIESNQILDRVAVIKVELGSPSAMWPLPGITLLTTTAPSNISAFYIDTDYGLRYKANSVQSSLKKSENYWDKKIKAFLTDVFKEEVFYEYAIGFAKMPTSSFKLMIEAAGKQDFKNKTLLLEHIDVSP